MAGIKRQLSANLARIAATAAILSLLALWFASASPSESVTDAYVSDDELDTMLGAPNPNPTAIIECSDQRQTDSSQSNLSITNQTGHLLQPAVTDNPPLLNGPRLYALGMIETGNVDSAIGRRGEVSRYQIMPSVWRYYSNSKHYTDAEISLAVARQHWSALHDYFKRRTNREPSDFDMYVLWNTRQGYYASKGFNPSRLNSVVRDRAQRFANLVELGARREARTGNSNGA